MEKHLDELDPEVAEIIVSLQIGRTVAVIVQR
jgi:hypothetical protein